MNTLGNVLPCLPINDVLDRRATNSKFSGQNHDSHTLCISRANISNLFLSKSSGTDLLAICRLTTAFHKHVAHVVSMSTDKQVFGVEAPRVVTSVQDMIKTADIESEIEHGRKAVNHLHSSEVTDGSVAVPPARTSPVPTTSYRINRSIRQEPGFERKRIVSLLVLVHTLAGAIPPLAALYHPCMHTERLSAFFTRLYRLTTLDLPRTGEGTVFTTLGCICIDSKGGVADKAVHSGRLGAHVSSNLSCRAGGASNTARRLRARKGLVDANSTTSGLAAETLSLNGHTFPKPPSTVSPNELAAWLGVTPYPARKAA